MGVAVETGCGTAIRAEANMMIARASLYLCMCVVSLYVMA